MTENEQNVAIAKAFNIAPCLLEWWVHSESEKSMCMSGTQKECLAWRDSLPPDSPYRKGDWEVVPHYVYPDYVNDLNLMHAAEKRLQDKCKYWPDYIDELSKLFRLDGELSDEPETNWSQMCHATAAQRAEALLRTLNLWKEL